MLWRRVDRPADRYALAVMTTAVLGRFKAWHASDALLFVAVAAWAATACALWFGLVSAPGGRALALPLLLGLPAGLTALAVLGRLNVRSLPIAAGAAWAVAVAIALPAFVGDNPKLALVVPAAAVAGMATHRFPTVSLTAIFALTGTYGSIIAFTGLQGDTIASYLLHGLWVGVIGRIVLGRRPVGLRVTPAVVLLAGFMVLSLAAMLATTPLGSGIRAFRLGPIYLSAVLLLGYGGFRERVFEQLSRAMVVIAAAVAAYAALRWAIGTAPQEESLRKTDFERQYNQLAGPDGAVKVQGSLPNGNLLGLWLACTTPLLVTVAVSWRGILRIVAIGSLPLTAIALLGSGQRTATAAVVAGALTVLVVHMVSRGFRGPRLGIAFAAVVTLIASAAVVYPVVLDSTEKRQRYENLLTPGEDEAFQERLTKWRSTLAEVRDEPFGFGLGSGNPLVVGRRFVDAGYDEIDNSYLMIAYDQGIIMMLFFIATMLVLLVELLRHAVWTRGPGPAALSTAAVGTLVAMLVEFVAANYVAAPPVVAGWMIVGLGMAQLVARHGLAGPSAPRQTASSASAEPSREKFARTRR